MHMPSPSNQVNVEYGIDRKTKEPVVVLAQNEQRFAVFSVAQARNFANDIVQACARGEADAMIHRFFDKQNYPEGAAAALMMEFRHFRAGLDSELVQRSMSEPTLDGSDKV